MVSFVFHLSESVTDTSISDVKARSHDPIIDTLIEILDDVESLIQKCPPVDIGSRFGNPAFRTLVDKVEEQLPAWHQRLGITDPGAVDQVATYLQNSFGDKLRLDYGSGHELNFALWLLCMNRISLLPPETFPHLALLVFPRYLRVMRVIQTTYYLEPAGSHGVWGLDDYQFLPFLFGASQLKHHKHMRPLSIHQNVILEQFGKDYLYLEQVAFVNSVKNVDGLRWHSPMLDDISSAKNWQKVEAGMRKMFLAEVLGKLPVMQHFLFGSLVPAVEGMSDEEASIATKSEHHDSDEDHTGHGHEVTGWGDCCGIKVPSSVGAMQEMKKSGDEGLRRLPFD